MNVESLRLIEQKEAKMECTKCDSESTEFWGFEVDDEEQPEQVVELWKCYSCDCIFQASKGGWEVVYYREIPVDPPAPSDGDLGEIPF